MTFLFKRFESTLDRTGQTCNGKSVPSFFRFCLRHSKARIWATWVKNCQTMFLTVNSCSKEIDNQTDYFNSLYTSVRLSPTSILAYFRKTAHILWRWIKLASKTVFQRCRELIFVLFCSLWIPSTIFRVWLQHFVFRFVARVPFSTCRVQLVSSKVWVWPNWWGSESAEVVDSFKMFRLRL